MAVVRSDLPDITVPVGITFPDWLLSLSVTLTNHTAFVDGVTEEQWTYTRLRDTVQYISAAFAARGLQKGDVICMYAPNSPWYACVLLAAMRLGIAVTGVNPFYTSGELRRQVLDSKARYMFTLPSLLSKVIGDIKEKFKIIFVLGEAEGYTSVETLLSEGRRHTTTVHISVYGREDIALLPYSSGTTGLPKGVILTHHNLIANVMQTIQSNSAIINHQGGAVVGVAPFFHTAGMVVGLFNALARCATYVIMPNFDYHRFLTLVEKYRATAMILVPPVLLRMAKDPHLSRYDLSSVREIGVGSAPVSEAVMKELSTKLGIRSICQGWGMSETTCVGTAHPRGSVKYASVGKLVPNTEAKVVDADTGAPLRLNERGEIWIRGPQNMAGYLNRPEATTQTIDSDGWLHTGDIGYFDENHYMYIVDRLKELIKYKGFQVAPAELESVLIQHPSVEDAAVFGIPDPTAGEVPRAHVVPKQGHSLTEADINVFILDKVAPYKRLRGGVLVTDHIPKSPSGKILRRLLQRSHSNSRQSKL